MLFRILRKPGSLLFALLLVSNADVWAQFASDRYLPQTVFVRLGVKEISAITTPAQDTLHSVFNARGQEASAASTNGIYVLRTYYARFCPDSVITRFVYDGQLAQMETAVYNYTDTAKAPSGKTGRTGFDKFSILVNYERTLSTRFSRPL